VCVKAIIPCTAATVKKLLIMIQIIFLKHNTSFHSLYVNEKFQKLLCIKMPWMNDIRKHVQKIRSIILSIFLYLR